MHTESRGIFEAIREFPDPDAARRFESLVGLDDVKDRLLKEAQMLLDPEAVERWSREHHGAKLAILTAFRDRGPLFLFAGDVGTGKTELALTFGDPVARRMERPVRLYPLSLTARGTGAVGEMTTLLASAFDNIGQAARKAVGKNGRANTAFVLLIDEADALAQSRESAQMHHEDRAGVNALIRGIDSLRMLPAVVVLCSNRLEAIDPAVQRRAAATFIFTRPTLEQRVALLTRALSDAEFSAKQIMSLAELTGPSEGRDYGYTFSDLAQRLLPALVLDAFPDRPLDFARAKAVIEKTLPTPPFQARTAK